jgi:protein FAM32A
MAKEDFATPGGSLKLKGVQNSKVDKKKKKKKRPQEQQQQPRSTNSELEGTHSRSPGRPTAGENADREEKSAGRETDGKEERTDAEEGAEEKDGEPYTGKTEAEERHEEMRRKRVCDSTFSILLLH